MPFKTIISNLLTQADHVNSAAFANNMAALKLLIADPTTELRFAIYSSGGMGHQSTAANIIYRLAALGLAGEHEVIYFPNDKAKILTLFPQLNPNDLSIPIVIGNATLYFIDDTTFQASDLPIQKIGLVGGVDGLSDNFAEYFRVNYLLVLQPYQWKLADSVIQRAVGVPMNASLDAFKALKELSFAKRGYYIANPQLDATNIGYFQSSAYADKYPTYSIITTALQASTINMMPIYGLANFENNKLQTATMLFNVATGVIIAQNNTNKVGGKVKGTVMVVISDLEDETYEEFTTLIDGTNPALDENPLEGWITANNLATRIKTYKYNDAALPGAIAALDGNPNNIVVVKMGLLPLYAFNYLYFIADMPTVFEGAATNSLVINFGKDYFALTSQLNADFTLYPTLPLNAVTASEDATVMKEVSVLINSTLLDWKRDINTGTQGTLPADILGLATLVAFEGNDSSGQVYFQSLGDFFHSDQEDKMLMGVFFLLQYLNHYNK
jgi:hypothetical protein